MRPTERCQQEAMPPRRVESLCAYHCSVAVIKSVTKTTYRKKNLFSAYSSRRLESTTIMVGEDGSSQA